MSRPVEDIEVDLAEVRADIRRLREREGELREELDARRVSDAEAEPHPWLGKVVKYEDSRYFGGSVWRQGTRKIVTFRGTVGIMVPELRRINGLNYSKPGDMIVLSKTGKKGWSLHRGWQLDEEAQS